MPSALKCTACGTELPPSAKFCPECAHPVAAAALAGTTSDVLDRFVTPVAATTALADAIPNARLAVLSGAPHMMQIESTDLFNAAVGAFLATLN